MPFGLGVGQVVALVRETRGFEDAQPQISVSGAGASELALALSAGGDAGAVELDDHYVHRSAYAGEREYTGDMAVSG